MKLLINLIGCIVALASLIAIALCSFIFCCLGKEAYLWFIKFIKTECRILSIRKALVAKRFDYIHLAFVKWLKVLADILLISSKSIASNSIRFILMWTFPALFIFSIVGISYSIEHEGCTSREKEILLELKQIKLDRTEFEIGLKADSLKRVSESKDAKTIP